MHSVWQKMLTLDARMTENLFSISYSWADFVNSSEGDFILILSVSCFQKFRKSKLKVPKLLRVTVDWRHGALK